MCSGDVILKIALCRNSSEKQNKSIERLDAPWSDLRLKPASELAGGPCWSFSLSPFFPGSPFFSPRIRGVKFLQAVRRLTWLLDGRFVPSSLRASLLID
jgi:hypothetical protein